MPVLAARDIVQRFGKQEVLHGVSLGVEPGEILGLLGPSGAGKTTFVNIMAGVAEPVSGTVRAFGEPMPFRSSWRASTPWPLQEHCSRKGAQVGTRR